MMSQVHRYTEIATNDTESRKIEHVHNATRRDLLLELREVSHNYDEHDYASADEHLEHVKSTIDALIKIYARHSDETATSMYRIDEHIEDNEIVDLLLNA